MSLSDKVTVCCGMVVGKITYMFTGEDAKAIVMAAICGAVSWLVKSLLDKHLKKQNNVQERQN